MKTFNFFQRFLALGVGLAALNATAQTYTWTTIAGQAGTTGTNSGTGSAAQFSTPWGITQSTNDDFFVSDMGNDTVRRVFFSSSVSNWIVRTIAGVPGDNSVNDGTNAIFDHPAGIVAIAVNDFYIVDGQPNNYDSALRQTAFGSGVWNTTSLTARSYEPNVTIFGFNQPSGVAVDTAGDIFVVDEHNNNVNEAMQTGANWTVKTIAGGSNGPGATDGTNLAALFNAPAGLAVDSSGNIYVTDTGNDTIRKITPVPGTTNWITTTIAGQAGNPGNFDGTNNAAQFNGPDGIAVDAADDLYVSDAGNNTIRKLVLQGTNWVVSTIGGQVDRAGAADGVGTLASFSHPVGLAVDGQGRVFVADYRNSTIRMGTPSTVTNPPPALQMATAGGAAFVMWPSSATGCVLQTSTNLNAGPWQTLSNGITTNLVFAGPITNGQAFFRLLQQ
jgi:sugar lactone lactonase YvrE